MLNRSTNFEVSNSTRFEDKKGDAKYRKWGCLVSLVIIEGHRILHHSMQRIVFK